MNIITQRFYLSISVYLPRCNVYFPNLIYIKYVLTALCNILFYLINLLSICTITYLRTIYFKTHNPWEEYVFYKVVWLKVSKCLHTGHGNEDAQYTMGDTVLNTTIKEKDLGLTISADVKVLEQYGIAAAKGNQILGLIRQKYSVQGKRTNNTTVQNNS